jgi:uncharacterized protein with von Willebrand factor type A (vWA) domain
MKNNMDITKMSPEELDKYIDECCERSYNESMRFRNSLSQEERDKLDNDPVAQRWESENEVIIDSVRRN